MDYLITFIEDHLINTEESNYFSVEMAGLTYPDDEHPVKNDSSNTEKSFKFEYIINGKGFLWINEQKLHLKKGDLFIVPPNTNYQIINDPKENLEKIWFNVYGPLCSSLCKVYSLDEFLYFENFNVYDIFIEFLANCEKETSKQQLVFNRCSLTFHKLLISICDQKNTFRKSILSPPYIAKEYIDNNIYKKITIEDLGEKTGMSTSQLTRLFKKEFLQTPYDYVISQKIKAAKLLLKGSNLSIKMIASKLNFTDEHYFSNCFKAKTNKTPSEYRKNKSS